MAHDVFISYSSKNKTTADAICHVLEEQGIKCWIAPRDIVGGEKYGNVIESAIKSCKVFVIIFSEESRISPWVESELNLAFTDRRTIVPFKIDSSLLEGEMRLILNNKHWIEAYPNPELKFKDLIEAVSRSIGKQTENETEKYNQEVQKQLQEEREQLEIEKKKLRKEQLQNDKAQKDIEEEIDITNKSEINTEESISNSQDKKMSFPFIIIMSIIFIGIILFFISISKKGNDDFSNSNLNTIASVNTTAADTLAFDSNVSVANNDNNKINVLQKADKNNSNYTEIKNETGTFTDSRDGHIYKWVKIGNQTWMAENLAYKCSEGCWAYNNDENNARKYGCLYNWETAMKVCPKGWHLPNEYEWKLLTNSISKDSVWLLLKEKSGWKLFNGDIFKTRKQDKLTGFCALPGGLMADGGEGDFRRIGDAGYWWASTTKSTSHASTFILDSDSYKYNLFIGQYWKQAGLSIRCIKNN